MKIKLWCDKHNQPLTPTVYADMREDGVGIQLRPFSDANVWHEESRTFIPDDGVWDVYESGWQCPSNPVDWDPDNDCAKYYKVTAS